MAVDPKRVAGRRVLRFTTLGEAVRDAEALAAGGHRTLGNYTLGQIASHLAQGIEWTLDGYPPELTVPLPLRVMGRLIRGRLVRRGFPVGIKPPGRLAEAFRPPDMATEDGVARFRRAVERMDAEPQRHPSPMFGQLSREDWEQFHCRHAELHLSFVVPA